MYAHGLKQFSGEQSVNGVKRVTSTLRSVPCLIIYTSLLRKGIFKIYLNLKIVLNNKK